LENGNRTGKTEGNAAMERITCCERCGSQDLRHDEVWGDELLHIGECFRCALRWTRPLRRAPLRAAVDRAHNLIERGAETIAA
jgi:hypothetical protein